MNKLVRNALALLGATYRFFPKADLILLATLIVELGGLEWVYFWMLRPYLTVGAHLLFDPQSATTSTAAIVTAAASLLLSGVIIAAPLLSLSLHQSYDMIFDIRRHVLSTVSETDLPHYKIIIDQSANRLCRQLRYYKILNPIYIGTWISSVSILTMACLHLIPISRDAFLPQDLFLESLSFLFSASVLVVLFSIISIIFFMITRPGVTKLALFSDYFDAERRAGASKGSVS